jgi:bifunctional DNase/RNase
MNGNDAAEVETGEPLEGEPAVGERLEGEPAVGERLEDDPAAPQRPERAAPEPMSQMLFVDVSLVLPATHPVVVLQEMEWPYRELRIPVGGAEGVAIGYAARRVDTPRPLTHEMISRLLDSFELSLDQVRITSVSGSNFVAELVVSGGLGVRTIDCRPSDAIALALKRSIPVPIMASPAVLEAAGGSAPSGN